MITRYQYFIYIYTQATVSTQNSLSQSAKQYVFFLTSPTEGCFLLCNKSMTLGPPTIYYIVRKPDNNSV